MGRPICYRADDETSTLVDEAAAALSLNRTDWLAGLVDRGLQGQGLLTGDQVAARRAARVDVANARREMGRGVRREPQESAP